MGWKSVNVINLIGIEVCRVENYKRKYGSD